MVVSNDQIYGRKPVITIVRELMARAEVDGSLRSQRFPILVVQGFRGAGKTALLSALDELLDQRVPYARLDFEANRHASVPQVLSALAFELSRKCPRYGVLQFPRFTVGQLVMGLELDLKVREKARKQVKEALEHQRGVDTVREVLAETAGNALGTIIEPPRNTLRIFLKWLTTLAPRRITLGSFQSWYGHQDLGLPNDSLDVLVDLNRDAKHTEQRVDDLLWRAFLADLRADFDRGKRTDERSLNCVVLLDNADTELGRRFLDQLVRARRQRAAGGQDDADPLTVVATSRVAMPDNTPGEPHRPTRARSRLWWRQYQLPDLTEDEVGRAVDALGLAQVNNQVLTRVVCQLTGGHPASTRLLLDAITRNPPTDLIKPDVTLSQAPSSDRPHHSLTVEDQIRDRLLGDVSGATLRDLTTCAAARDQPDTLALSAQNDLVAGGHDYPEILDPILWPSDNTAGPALLRRLLQRRLALRVSADPSSWRDVYERLRDVRRTKGEASELYYALAGGNLGFVARRLHQRITELEDKRWFELLKSVTAAPREHRQRHSLLDEVSMLKREAAVEQPFTSLTGLIAELWIAANPFIDSDRGDLHRQIAASYSDVARLTPDGPSAVLLRESSRHQREAEWWS